MNDRLKKIYPYILAAAALIGLYIASETNYLLFHTLAELFSVVIAYAIFMIAWNTRQLVENHFFLFIGSTFLFVGCVDLTHMLSYKGMPLFQGSGANEATQLWIAARYIQSLSLLISPIFLRRKMNLPLWLSVYAVVTVLLLLSIFRWQIFPDCFLEETGLTLFKRFSEYTISSFFLIAAFLLWKEKDRQDPKVLRWLLIAIGFLVAGEIVFTGYISVYSSANLAGHYFKILSFFFIYKAIIQTGLTQPYAILFHDLKKNQSALTEARIKLEEKVDERTAELRLAIDDLSDEVRQRMQAETMLRQLSRKSIDALESDRKAMSKELHDSIGASLSAIKLLLEDVVLDLKNEKSWHSTRLEKAIFYLFETIQETKRISAGLRPLTLEDLGLVSTINAYARQFSDLYKSMKTELSLDMSEEDIPEHLKIVIYRLMQEALNNAGKHSRANRIRIRLAEVDRFIRFEVVDDGTGFDPDRRHASGSDLSGHGLQGMRERVEIIGGDFLLISSPGAGTTIRATFPVDNAIAEDTGKLAREEMK